MAGRITMQMQVLGLPVTHLAPIDIFHHKTQTVFCLEGIFQRLEMKKEKMLYYNPTLL